MGKMLVVVDMLNDFVGEGGSLFFQAGKNIIPAVKARIDAYRALKGGRVVFVNDAHDVDDVEFRKWPAHAVKGTAGASVVGELAPLLGEAVFEKTRYSGWYKTPMSLLVKTEMPDEVEIVGVCTGICVMDTVTGFANRDIKTVIHRNAVADFDLARHEMCLRRMQDVYGTEII